MIPKDVKVSMLASQQTGTVARKFRKAFVLPFDKWNSGRHLNSAAKQLSARLSVFKGVGTAATWYVPAAIGLCGVANAPKGQQMRELFGQGFSVLGGALGTHAGLWAANAILSGLCLGPFGMFFIVVVCTGLVGYLAMNISKDFDYKVYDVGSQLGNEQIYHSADQLIKGL